MISLIQVGRGDNYISSLYCCQWDLIIVFFFSFFFFLSLCLWTFFSNFNFCLSSLWWYYTLFLGASFKPLVFTFLQQPTSFCLCLVCFIYPLFLQACLTHLLLLIYYSALLLIKDPIFCHFFIHLPVSTTSLLLAIFCFSQISSL